MKTDEECAICKEPLHIDDNGGPNTVVTSVCNHQFHYKCIQAWEVLKPSCPLCRYNSGFTNQILNGRHTYVSVDSDSDSDSAPSPEMYWSRNELYDRLSQHGVLLILDDIAHGEDSYQNPESNEEDPVQMYYCRGCHAFYDGNAQCCDRMDHVSFPGYFE